MNATWLRLGRCSLSFTATGLLLCSAPLKAQAPAPAAAAPAAVEPAPAATEPAPDQSATSEPAPPPGVNLPGKDPLEENFAAYLNFARIGQFDMADKFAVAFLQQPG